MTMSALADAPVDARTLSKLKWRCRRGLLENDLFIERFFADRGDAVTARQADGLAALMDLADNDLLDLLLRRAEPSAALQRDDVAEVLALLRRPRPGTAEDHGPSRARTGETTPPPAPHPLIKERP
jgi:antitoxin CptB